MGQNGTNSNVKVSNGAATASLILGILSIVLSFVWWMGIALGILAIALAIVGKNKIKKNPEDNYGGSGAAITGIVTGIVGIIIASLVLYFTIILVNAFIDHSEEFKDAFKKGLESMDTLSFD